MIKYLQNFSDIILWGAGHLGRKLGQRLLELSLPLSCYWDLRAEKIGECNGLPVYQPFSGTYDSNNALVIFSVTSGLIQGESLQKLKHNGYHYISGMEVYQQLICPLSEEHLDISECCNRPECNVDTCGKLNKLLLDSYYREDKILLETGYLFITQRCSLRCKYCIAYMNSYAPELRYDYSVERILKDIDRLSEACSYIKRVVVYGGEPLLHPGIQEIVQRLVEKKNIGIIDIVTNGIYKQPDSVMQSLKQRNVQIEISNYEEALLPQQIDARNKNIDRMKALGLKPTLHGITPEWIKPRTFYNKEWGEEQRIKLKQECDYFAASMGNKVKQSMVIANGRFYPCRMACSIHTLGVAEYPEDYVEVDSCQGQAMVEALNALYGRKCFMTCGHCDARQGEITQMAGEQGFDERYAVTESGKSEEAR